MPDKKAGMNGDMHDVTPCKGGVPLPAALPKDGVPLLSPQAAAEEGLLSASWGKYVLSLAVFGLFLFIAVLIWRLDVSRVARQVETARQFTAEQAALRLEQYFKVRIDLIRSVANASDHAASLRSGRELLATLPGLRALGWRRRGDGLDVVMPELTGSLLRRVRDFPLGPERKMVAATVRSLQGQGGQPDLIVWLPRKADGGDTGHSGVIAAFRLRPMVEEALSPRVLEQFEARLSGPDGLIYASDSERGDIRPAADDGQVVRITNRQWRLYLTPRPELAESFSSPTARLSALVIAVLGAIVSVLLLLQLRKRETLNQLREEARIAGQRLAILTENAAEAFALFDENGSLLISNRLFRHLFSGKDGKCTNGEQSLWQLAECLSHQTKTPDGGKELRRFINTFKAYPDDNATLEIELADGRWYQFVLWRFAGIGISFSAHEITEHKAAEQALAEAAQAAEEADRVKSRFLAAASHDLRQPLHALGIFATALMRNAKSDEDRVLITKIQSARQSLEMLISSLLDISRLDAGVVEPRRQDFALNTILQRIRLEAGAEAEEKGIRLILVPTRLHVHSDPGLLHSVIRNLVANAIRYTEKGKVLIGCRRHGDCLRLEVWDTGPGIPPEKQAEIFEEFRRLDRDAKSHPQGAGLGLSIVDRLCKLLEHPLHMDSWPGRGTRFAIDIPLAAAGDSCMPVRIVAHPCAPEEKLAVKAAIIGGNEDAGRYIRHWGGQVRAYEDFAALKADGDYLGGLDVVLCDDVLAAGQDTTVLAAELGGAEIGFIALSRHLDADCRDGFRKLGWLALQVPVNPARLRAALNAVKNETRHSASRA